MNQKIKMTFKSLLVAVMIFIILRLLSVADIILVAYKSFKDYHLDENSFDAESLRIVEERTGIPLPAGSRGLNMFWAGARSIDPAFVAKIEIPESSHEAVVQYLERIDIDNRLSVSGGSLTKDVIWWAPSRGNILVERRFYHGGSYAHALLCHENDRWILYVEYFQI